jgi:hypothetical protein
MNKSDQIPATNPSEVEALIERVEGGQMRAGDAQLIGRWLRLMHRSSAALETWRAATPSYSASWCRSNTMIMARAAR